MPRPQFSIRTLLWLTLVVAVLARSAWPAVDWVSQMTEIDFSSGTPALTAEDWAIPSPDEAPFRHTGLEHYPTAPPRGAFSRAGG